MANNKIYELRKKLLKNQEITEEMFNDLTSKDMMNLTLLLMSDYFSLSRYIKETNGDIKAKN